LNARTDVIENENAQIKSENQKLKKESAELRARLDKIEKMLKVK
jgi:outer membrane murein-binding lipoprotein Lpp